MMRPMKLAGSQLLFGNGCLEFLASIPTKRAMIVIGGSSLEKNGMLARVEGYLAQAGAQTAVIRGVEADPSFATVQRGAAEMLAFRPDFIVALGGGSPMDAAKAMWVYYEHPELKTLQALLEANPFPTLRGKARFCCIPSTSGTASEVSRSVVITENGAKHGLGNMEMMPDIAICDPQVTVSMPPHITAETGMDAMTHALEALVSTRANYLSSILARRAVTDIAQALPVAFRDGKDIAARETMLNASMIAGMAFTNVSLGIVHSMAHTIGGFFHVAHGLADAVILPYVIAFNSADARAKKLYEDMAAELGGGALSEQIAELNRTVSIPAVLQALIPDEAAFRARLDEMAGMALADGCTKTNPIIPTAEQMKTLLLTAYLGMH